MSTHCSSRPIANVTLEGEALQSDSSQLEPCFQTTALIEVKECKKANGVYEPHCEAYNGKPVWKRRDGEESCYIFCNGRKGAWFLNTKLSNEGCFASVRSTAALPPPGCWNRSGHAVLAAHDTDHGLIGPSIADAINPVSDTIEVRECKKANGIYELQPELHSARELWRRRDGACYIFFCANKEAWYIHKKLGNQGYASVSSTADKPPMGRWDSCGLAVLVAHAAQRPVDSMKNFEYTITLETSEAAASQLKNQWESAFQQFASLSKVSKRKMQDVADMVECIVTDAEGVCLTRCGLPDLSDEMEELKFPLNIHLRFPDPRAKPEKALGLIAFATAEAGQLAARGAPGPGVMANWVHNAGATCVVTLLRVDEPAFPSVHAQATALVAEGSLKHWLHLPLSGGARCMSSSIKKRSEALEVEDQRSLARVKEVAELLKRGEIVVVHCAAGMHRTGIVCYMALRLLGQSAEEALESIFQSRPVTHSEVTKTTKRHPPLCELAEQLLSEEAL